MAFKLDPGRGNRMKTGAGISPVLMTGSPMHQQKKTDPYTGKSWSELGTEIENFASENQRRLASERIAKNDSTSAANNALKIDPKLSKKMAARIGNEAGNKTRTEKKIPVVKRGKEVEYGSAYSDPKNPDAYFRNSQLERDFPTSLLRAYVKATPARQMSKGAVDKTAMVPADKKPKASKPPIKQMSKLKKKC
jgi:hypothetical protein